MKNITISLISLFLLLSIKSSSQIDYKIQINDTLMEVALDEEYNLVLDNKEIKFKIVSKDTLVYQDDSFKFNYSKDYRVSRVEIDKDIEQVMIVNAEGSGFMIQKYSTINPTTLNEIMLSEITKESVSYGYNLKREDYTRKLKSGRSLDVDKAILTYKDDTSIYEIASIGNKDEGIIILTMISVDEISTEGKKILEMMWDSLEYK